MKILLADDNGAEVPQSEPHDQNINNTDIILKIHCFLFPNPDRIGTRKSK